MWLLKSHNTEKPDAYLIRKYRDTGNLIFVEDLYSRYIHLIYGTCLKYLKQREKSQDAVMDIFEQLVEKLKQHEIKYFKPWLYTLTRNHCLMVLRKEAGVKEAPLDLFSQNLPEQIMDSQSEFHPFDVDEALTDQEDVLKECMEALKEKQKSCVRLFYLDGYSYQQIAKQLSLKKEAVKSNIQNGKRNLKNCMNHKNGRRKKE